MSPEHARSPLHVRRQRKQRQTRGTAEVAVEIHAVLEAGDAEFAPRAARPLRFAPASGGPTRRRLLSTRRRFRSTPSAQGMRMRGSRRPPRRRATDAVCAPHRPAPGIQLLSGASSSCPRRSQPTTTASLLSTAGQPPTGTSSPPSPLELAARGSQHARSDCIESFRDRGAALDVARALDHLANFFHVAARFLDPDHVRMLRQFDHHFGGNVISRKRRERCR